MIGGICLEDEVVYSNSALRDYYNSNDKLIEGFKNLENEPFMFHSYPLHYLSYKCFGNTFIGQRAPAVLISLIIIILLYKITQHIQLEYYSIKEKGYFLPLFVLFLVSTDFTFFTFSRYNQPLIYSILAITLFLYILFQNNLKKNKTLILGVLGALSVLYIYPYNAFLPTGFFLGTFLYLVFNKESISEYKQLLFVSLGGLLGIFIFIIGLYLTGHSIQEYLGSFTEYDNARPTINTDSWFKNLLNPIGILTTNLFRFNPVLLWGFLFIIFHYGKLILTKKGKRYHFIILSIIIMAFFQSIFVNSYPFKKWIVLMPFAIVGVVEIMLNHKNKKELIGTFIPCLLIYLYAVKVNNSSVYWEALNYGYYDNLPFYFYVAFTISLILLLTFLLIKKIRFYPIIFIPFIASIYFVYFNKPSFATKEGLQKFAPKISNKPLFTTFAYSYSFYSNAIPLCNSYDIQFAPSRFSDYLLKIENANFDEVFYTLKIMPIDQENFNKKIGDSVLYNDQKLRLIDKFDTRYYKVFLLK
ncbi:hypothetical protein [Crocinitomix catalasitica]|uniref:hypothetical protein n=1 Tax=Crocinitomix catalasitica TaxID=184607 RepID=UPI0004891BE7|nr:hypothetical protein [Crocinitomix catalasitica]